MSETNNEIVVASSNQLGLIRPVASPSELITAHKEAVAVIQQVLDKGTDYGVIPGTGDKPTLLKPGAERLLTAFGTYARPEIIESEVDHDRENSYDAVKWEFSKTKPSKAEGDRMKAEGLGRWKKTDDGWSWQDKHVESGTSQGFYRYVIRCDIVHRQTGSVIASGIGSCSTMETKYIRSPRDYENTIVKMAKKRAMIDATLNAFGLSDRFTQDVEDLPVETPTAAPQPDEKPVDGNKAVGQQFLRNLFAKDLPRLKVYQDLCITRSVSNLDVAFEASQAGVKTIEQLMAYLDGDLPGIVIEAQIVDEYDPYADTENVNSASVAAQAPLEKSA